MRRDTTVRLRAGDKITLGRDPTVLCFDEDEDDDSRANSPLPMAQTTFPGGRRFQNLDAPEGGVTLPPLAGTPRSSHGRRLPTTPLSVPERASFSGRRDAAEAPGWGSPSLRVRGAGVAASSRDIPVLSWLDSSWVPMGVSSAPEREEPLRETGAREYMGPRMGEVGQEGIVLGVCLFAVGGRTAWRVSAG